MTKQTVANNPFLAACKRLYNVPIYKGVAEAVNAAGPLGGVAAGAKYLAKTLGGSPSEYLDPEDTLRSFGRGTATSRPKAKVKKASGPMTGHEMLAQINNALLSVFGHMKFHATYTLNRLAPEARMGTFWIRFQNVPKGASELDTLNANHKVWIKVQAAGEPEYGNRTLWPFGDLAPEKVKASDEHNRGFRAKTGTPQAIVDYIIKYFMEHKAELLVPYDPNHWRRKS